MSAVFSTPEKKGGERVYEESEQEMTEKLRQVEKSGVSLFLEGRPAAPEDIAYKCVREETVYMADYILDESGILKELRYDKVTDWK